MDGFKILVVDDETDFLETIVARLKKRKLDATGVTSGEAAIDLLNKQPFDVVLLDIKMPGGVDGIETLWKIKKIRPLTEVILITAYASVETTTEGIKQGAFDYLLKPVRLEELLGQIIAALEKKSKHDKKISGAMIQDLKRQTGSTSSWEE